MRISAKAFNYVFHGKLRHISRFSIVGEANTLVDFLAFTALQELFRLAYIPSQILGYSCGILNSFILNRKWTFNDNSNNKKAIHELIQFTVVNLFTLAATLTAMSLLVKGLNLNVYLAKIFVTLMAQFINFLSYKLWVFS